MLIEHQQIVGDPSFVWDPGWICLHPLHFRCWFAIGSSLAMDQPSFSSVMVVPRIRYEQVVRMTMLGQLYISYLVDILGLQHIRIKLSSDATVLHL